MQADHSPGKVWQFQSGRKSLGKWKSRQKLKSVSSEPWHHFESNIPKIFRGGGIAHSPDPREATTVDHSVKQYIDESLPVQLEKSGNLIYSGNNGSNVLVAMNEVTLVLGIFPGMVWGRSLAINNLVHWKHVNYRQISKEKASANKTKNCKY